MPPIPLTPVPGADDGPPNDDERSPFARTAADGPPVEDLLHSTARGDERAFETLYDRFAARVFGLARRLVRDPAQAEEVTQEVFLEIWRRASRFDRTRGSGTSWIMTLTHARAVDRIRSAQAASERETKAAQMGTERDVDTVVEQVESAFERRAVQRCLGTLTDLQRESITLAYYSGYTYREVGELLSTPLPTVKTRLRDGLIRLRDCLGVALEVTPITAPDLHLDTGAMALDALPDDERAAFATHLDDCETCPPELAGFTETVARLAVLTAERPPAGLKQRVLEAITTIPQLPPLTDRGRHRATDTPRAADTAVAADPAGEDVGRATRTSPDAEVIPLRPWYRRTTSLVAAAVVALALLVGGVVVANRTASSDVAAQAACVATAPDATVTPPTVGDVGEVRYAPSCGAATVDVSGIAAPPAGQQYQMWFIAGQTITSAALMSQDAASPESHTATVPVSDPSAQIGITVEPTGGSAQPTSDPLWVAPIQS